MKVAVFFISTLQLIGHFQIHDLLVSRHGNLMLLLSYRALLVASNRNPSKYLKYQRGFIVRKRGSLLGLKQKVPLELRSGGQGPRQPLPISLSLG